jgi:hypothetical protein
MNLWTMIVLVVLIGSITGVLTERYKAMGRLRDERDDRHTPDNGNAAEAQREIKALRERIAVLERIATDNNSLDARERARIATEIEALREPNVSNAEQERTDQ